MPIHLDSSPVARFSRRGFIAGSLAAAVNVIDHRLSGQAAGVIPVDADWIAILNDTHIGAQHKPDSPIPSHLRETVAWLLAQPKRPVAVVINGDLALKDGQPADYEHFARLIAPLREAGLPLHLTLGNHDARDVFHEVLTSERQANPPVASRHVSVVRLPGVNLFLLDSLKQTMIAQGDLGDAQRAWLARMLDAHADKPALVLGHHNPRLGGDPRHFPGGLEDSEALWEVLASRRHVKAYLHGHIHHRDFFKHQDIHILNTPATSYVADPKTSTTGWTMLRLRRDGVEVTTHTHLPDHPWNNQVVSLDWRA